MTLGQEQEAFATDVTVLLIQAWKMGYKVRIGEVWRPIEMQRIYVQQGRSKTMNSMHMKKCAIDLILLRDGIICSREQIKPLGEFWESINPKNRWGGNWRGLVDAGKSSFVDAPHFERLV
jgi:hypothetical protein